MDYEGMMVSASRTWHRVFSRSSTTTHRNSGALTLSLLRNTRSPNATVQQNKCRQYAHVQPIPAEPSHPTEAKNRTTLGVGPESWNHNAHTHSIFLILFSTAVSVQSTVLHQYTPFKNCKNKPERNFLVENQRGSFASLGKSVVGAHVPTKKSRHGDIK